jgi:hypothetical protein
MNTFRTRSLPRRPRRGAAALAAAGGIAALLLAGVPALASTHSAAAKTTTGPEVVQGAVHGKAANANVTRIPLTLHGVVNTTDPGFALGSGGGDNHVLATKAGRLAVHGLGKEAQSQTANLKTCHVTFTIRQRFSVVTGKSTGAFAGASGPGAYQVYFAAFFPRHTSGPHKGQCNTSNSAKPLNKGAYASFLASVVLTARA